jgi:apolipoprotein N-acyltransferase
MGCLVILFALITPRVVLFFLWLFTDYLNRAFESGWWGVIGFFLLPTTTIAYAIAQNEFTTRTGGLEAAGVIMIVLGVVLDLGLLGGGRWGYKGRGIARRPSD